MTRKLRHALTLLVLALAALSCAPRLEPSGEASNVPGAVQPGAVILLIGDGFGPSQITFSRLFNHGKGGRFAFESLPVTALVTTWSASDITTDSAAAATAMSSGIKTKNHTIGLDREMREVRTFGELVHEKGWKVGVVTTTRLTHATPAAFYGHIPNRYDDELDLPEQLLAFRPEIALGGGLGRFLPEGRGNDDLGDREDGRELLAEAEAAGFSVLREGFDFAALPPEPVLGLLGAGHLPFVLDDRRRPEGERRPSLETLARYALRSLSRDDRPFFLMIEGGRIDHGAHAFDAAAMALEAEDFDQAVTAVLEYRHRHPNTLVVLTADHATAGLAINDFARLDEIRRQRMSVAAMADEIRDHGAGADLVREMTGYELTGDEIESILAAPDRYEGNRRLGHLLADRHGVTWVPRVDEDNTDGHTGEDVFLYAGGPGAERFQGVLDHTDIPRLIADILGWEPPNEDP